MTPRRWVLAGLAALLLAIGVGLSWLLNSNSGARWAADVAANLLGGKLAVGDVSGTIAGPLEITGLRYHDRETGLDVRVEHASVDVALREFFAWRAHIENATARNVIVALGKPTKDEPDRPFSLTPPIDVLLDAFTLEGAQVLRDGKMLVLVTRASASGAWTDAGIALSWLEATSPQGYVKLKGDVNGEGTYAGRVSGEGSWRIGDLIYAGSLSAVGERKLVTLQARLETPFVAGLAGTFEQRATFPWKLELRVPQFDPREGLMPDSSIESLATSLDGSGDNSHVDLAGSVTVNGQRLRIAPLRAHLQESVVKIDALTLIDPSGRGRMQVNGDVRLDRAPFYADLDVIWRDVSLPREWVAQELATHGELHVKGDPSTFAASGDLALGPPRQLANITLALTGTPERIELEKLVIEQRAGRANATGRIQLKPEIGWEIKAQASRFDPGEFFAGWPGRMDFDIDSQGRRTPHGPAAEFEMRGLRGTLRGRPISGAAALALAPNKVVSGNLNVRSGGSSVRVTGVRGQALNVTAEFDIETLDDWMPGAGGRAKGKFHVTGKWPAIDIKGDVDGRRLAMLEYSAQSATVRVDMKNPLHPQGALTVSATSVRAPRFEFETVAFEASGNERAHTADLAAVGEQLNVEMKVKGARQGKGWSGSIDELRLSAPQVTKLSLREPAQVTWSPGAFSISQSCLVGEGVGLCVTAEQDAASGLKASYRLDHLPIALIAAVAKPDLGLELKGALQGTGEIRRAVDGALFGEAHITSASGSAQPAEDAGEALLSYENFKMDVALEGESATASTSMSLEATSSSGGGAATGKGQISGQAKLAALRSPAPTLEGHAELAIGNLAPLALFTTQVADVSGRASAKLDFGGTVVEPKISGSASVEGFSAELPILGVKLREGRLQASMRPEGGISVDGEIASGEGRLTFNGDAGEDGALKVKIAGQDFLAADIPAAHIIMAPELELSRSKERMHLGGTVVVPQAKIDLTKLPQNKARAVSADVVVIDDEAVVRSRSTPLYADITVMLGKKVQLVGFGLDATLTGQLAVKEVPLEPATGAGEIRVAGTYKAYGQDLTIQTGRLFFANSPLDNPQVGLVATRTLPEATIKLAVSGSARAPLLSVSSDPPLAPTQALSYLVTGKPISELGSGEGDMVQSAARSLGGAAGNLLAKGLGKRIGVDEIGVENSAELGGSSAFTIGQYLSPRLYLSYGVGLFEPGQVITLRYRISKKISLEAIQGPLNQQAGVTYKIEK